MAKAQKRARDSENSKELPPHAPPKKAKYTKESNTNKKDTPTTKSKTKFLSESYIIIIINDFEDAPVL